MPYDMETSANQETELNVGDERPAGFTPTNLPMDPNTARENDFLCVGCRHNVGTRQMQCSHSLCDTCFDKNAAGEFDFKKYSQTRLTNDDAILGAACSVCYTITPFEMVQTMTSDHTPARGPECAIRYVQFFNDF